MTKTDMKEASRALLGQSGNNHNNLETLVMAWYLCVLLIMGVKFPLIKKAFMQFLLKVT